MHAVSFYVTIVTYLVTNVNHFICAFKDLAGVKGRNSGALSGICFPPTYWRGLADYGIRLACACSITLLMSSTVSFNAAIVWFA
jgi:hypothetical protein